jgi:hypothetical protein
MTNALIDTRTEMGGFWFNVYLMPAIVDIFVSVRIEVGLFWC